MAPDMVGVREVLGTYIYYNEFIDYSYWIGFTRRSVRDDESVFSSSAVDIRTSVRFESPPDCEKRETADSPPEPKSIPRRGMNFCGPRLCVSMSAALSALLT